MAVVSPSAPRQVAEEGDGSQLVLVGGSRARVRQAEVTWSPDRTASALLSAARSDGAWWSATEDGVLYRAPEFVAPLTRVAETEGVVFEAAFRAEGVLALRASNGALWLGGPGGLRPVPLAGARDVVSAVFRDATTGLLLARPGAVFRTADGGVRWERVSIGDGAALEVRVATGGFALRTTQGWFGVDARGTLEALTGAPPAKPSDRVDPRVASLLSSTQPNAALVDEANGLLEDGTAFRGEDGELWMHRPGAPEPVRLPWPRPAQDGSGELYGWGTRVVWTHQPSEEATTEVFVTEGERWSSLGRLPGRVDLQPSRDGWALFAPTRCAHSGGARTTSEPPDGKSGCWYHHGAWHDREFAGRLRQALPWADRLLYQVEVPQREAGVYHAPETYEVRADEAGPGRRVEPPSGAGVRWHTVTGDGTLVGRLDSSGETGDTRIVLGPLGGALEVRTAPRWPAEFAFADALHGLAVDPARGQAWTTEDGGRSWQGRAEWSGSLQKEKGDRLAPTGVECVPGLCRAKGGLLWTSRPVVPLQVHPGRGLSRPPPVIRRASRYERWRCDRDGGKGPAEASRWYGDGGWLEARRELVSGRWTVRWGGVDQRGSFEVGSRPGSVLQGGGTSRQLASFAEEVLTPRLVRRSMALFERCTPSNGHVVCELLVAPAGGAVLRLGTLAELLGLGRDEPVALRGALGGDALAGGALVHLYARRAAPSDDGQRWYELDGVLQLDARGRVVRARRYVFAQDAVRLLAAGPRGVGLATFRADDDRAVVLDSIDPAQEPVVLSDREFWMAWVPCADDGSVGARDTTLVSTGGPYGPAFTLGDWSLLGGVLSEERTQEGQTFELDTYAAGLGHKAVTFRVRSDGEVCLSSMVPFVRGIGMLGRRERHLDALGGGVRLEARQHEMSGEARDGHAVVRLSCRHE